MAEIREKLILEDQYSGGMNAAATAAERAASSNKAVQAAVKQTSSASSAAGAAARSAASGQGAYNQKLEEGKAAAGSMSGALTGLIGSYLSWQTVTSAMKTSDLYTSTNARLGLLTDNLEQQKALQEGIYQAAQRSRGSYTAMADAVAKMGLNAGHVFASNQELVAFTEAVQKQFVVGAAGAQQQEATMLQLTQAMAAGALRGEELNSILDAAPGIARAIESSMGWATGSIKQYAEQGLITSEIVKSAVLGMAQTTDEQLKTMPYTWAQVWTVMKNAALKFLQPVLNGINWMANHIEIVGPIVLAVAAAMGGMAIATGAASAKMAIMNLIAAANPFTLLVAVIFLVVGAFYAAVAAYNEFTGASVSATGIIIGAAQAMNAGLYNLFIYPAMLGLSMFGNFLHNFANDPIAAVKVLFYDLAIYAIEHVKWIAESIQALMNSIPGVKLNITGGLDRLHGAAVSARNQVVQESGWEERWTQPEMKDVVGEYMSGYQSGQSFDAKVGNFIHGIGTVGDMGGWSDQMAGMNDTLGSIDKSVGNIEGSVDMSQEDLRSMIDMAERQYISNVNLTTQAPVISVTGANTGSTEADRRNMAAAIKTVLSEQMVSSSYRATADPI